MSKMFSLVLQIMALEDCMLDFMFYWQKGDNLIYSFDVELNLGLEFVFISVTL